jgi:hypothetical protein
MKTLSKGDSLILTQKNGDIHNVIFEAETNNGVFVNFIGFGKLEIEWSKVEILQKIIPPQVNPEGAYGATFKVIIYHN